MCKKYVIRLIWVNGKFKSALIKYIVYWIILVKLTSFAFLKRNSQYFSSSFTGKFHSKAVVEALLDLLYDRDNNIRAIAAISLAKAGENSPKIVKSLMKCLNDKDRLVREGTCLALGHLKAQQAVTKILHLW